MRATDKLDPAGVEPLRLAILRMARRLRKRSETGLPSARMSALMTIERHGSMRLGRLAQSEQITKSTITRLVAGLVADGLVIRTPDPEDARCARIQITGEGRRLLAESNRRADAYLAGLLAAMPAADRALLLEVAPVLQRLREVKA